MSWKPAPAATPSSRWSATPIRRQRLVANHATAASGSSFKVSSTGPAITTGGAWSAGSQPAAAEMPISINPIGQAASADSENVRA